MPTIVLNDTAWDEITDDGGARIYGGIHFRFD